MSSLEISREGQEVHDQVAARNAALTGAGPLPERPIERTLREEAGQGVRTLPTVSCPACGGDRVHPVSAEAGTPSDTLLNAARVVFLCSCGRTFEIGFRHQQDGTTRVVVNVVRL